MYKVCPKCGYERSFKDKGSDNICPACQLDFQTWLKQTFKQAKSPTPSPRIHHNPLPQKQPSVSGTSMLCQQGTNFDPMVFKGHVFLFVVFLIWGWQLINAPYFYLLGDIRINMMLPDINQSFMHSINLIFHEAGHWIFAPFGRFMAVLGGSLMQLLIPLVVMLTFLLREGNLLGAAVGFWWLGESFIDLAPYINDARTGQIPLLGGTTGADSPGYHDWTNILGELGWLEADHRIADRIDNLGGFIMCLSVLWMACILKTSYKQRNES